MSKPTHSPIRGRKGTTVSLAARHRLGVVIAVIVALCAMAFAAVFVAAPARADDRGLISELPEPVYVAPTCDAAGFVVPSNDPRYFWNVGAVVNGYLPIWAELTDSSLHVFDLAALGGIDGTQFLFTVDFAVLTEPLSGPECGVDTGTGEGRSEAAPGRNGTNPGLGATNGNAQGGKPEVPVRRGQTVASRSGDRVALVVSATTASQPAAAVANIDGESLASGVAAGKSSPMLELQSPAAGVAAVLALIVLAVYGAVRSFRSTRMPSRV